MRLRSLASWVVLIACAGCGTKIQEQYKIDVVTPGDDFYLTGATSAVLEIGTQSYTTKVTPGAPFTLSGDNLAINSEMAGVFRVRVLDAQGNVVAQGQSPELELLLATPPLIRIYIQKPGTFGRTQNLDYPRRHMVAVAAPAAPSAGSTAQARTITVAFLGLGTVLVPSGTSTVEQPSPVFNMYNPITHFLDDGGLSGQLGGARLPRTDASAVTHSDGHVLVFGGTATSTMGMPPVTTTAPSSQLDIISLSRTDFDMFTPSGTVRAADPPMGIPRASAAMVDDSVAYVIGGIGDKETMPGVIEQKPLDTVVAVDPAMDATYRVLQPHMAAPRVGHTATVVATQGTKEVLIFGGAAADQSVAEVLAGDMFNPVTGAQPAFQRRDHAALVLPDQRVIIIGGRNDKGALGDSVLYEPATRTLSAGPIALKTPRYSFAAFVINDDVVVAGGYDATGAPLGTAEIYSAKDLHLKAVDVPCYKRAEASVVALSNESVLIAGGSEPVDPPATGTRPSAVEELYQPLRP